MGEDGKTLRERSYEWTQDGPLAKVADSRYGSRVFELDEMGRPRKVKGLGAEEEYVFSPQGTPIPKNNPTWSIGADGRPTAAAGTHLSWDRRGRLVARSHPDPKLSWRYGYDQDNRLVEALRGDGVKVQYLL